MFRGEVFPRPQIYCEADSVRVLAAWAKIDPNHSLNVGATDISL